MHILSLSCLLVALATILAVNAANIMFFHLTASASCRNSIFPLATRLADAGHNVTYIFSLKNRPGSHPGVEEFVAKKFVDAGDTFFRSCEINHRLNNTLNEWMYEYFMTTPHFCAEFYDSSETQELLKRRPGYDLILMDGIFGQCAYGLVHHFKAKHILFNIITYPFLHESFGLLPESSSVPDWMFFPKASDLKNSLWSRTLNTVAPFLWNNLFLNSMDGMEKVVREKFRVTDANPMPSFQEIEQETSLVLHNTYFIEDYPMSFPPFYVSYAGLQCSKNELAKRKPLPEKLETFLKDTDGFIYISFGSAVAVSSLPDALMNHFMTMFKAFPNLKFFWKWNGPELTNLPKNVLVQPWFPQMDILAHSKVKAFMSQVGRPSTQEAICYGVPIIAVPMFADQVMNADRLQDLGYGIHLDIDTLTGDSFIAAIKNMTETDRYKTKALELSALYRDRPMDPLDSAHYWVEYVLRHNSTDLLKPLAMKQPWWQRRLLDVYALLLTIFLLLLALCILVGYGIIKCVTRALTPSKSLQNRSLSKKKN